MATVYEMLMKLGLENQVSSGLLTIGTQLTNISNLVQGISAGFGGWKLAIGAVGVALVGGTFVKGLEDIAKHGGKVNHEIELMKLATMTTAEMNEAMAAAIKTSGNVMTTTLSENLGHITELRMAFGDTATAIHHLDEVSKANSILNAIKGGGHDQVWSLVKALEGKGETANPAEFSSYVNTMTKVVEATRGKVTPEMFMSAFKYGRTSTLGWSEEFIGGALPRMIQSMSSGSGGGGGGGAGGPGSALMSLFSEMVGGHIPKAAAEEMEKMGLGTAKHNKGGDMSKLNNIPGTDLLLSNPYEWVQQHVMPALTAKGITGQNEIIAEIGKMFPNRLASQIVAEMGLQGRARLGEASPFEKDIKLQKGAMNMVPAFDELLKNDYPTIMKAFNDQWRNLLEIIGSQLMAPGGPVIKALAGITSAMGSMAQFAAAHPEAIKIILASMAGLAAAFVVLGAGAVITAAAFLIPGGLIIAAIAGIAGAITALGALAYMEWDKIKAAFETVKNVVVGLYSLQWDLLVAGFNTMKNAIQSFLDWVTSTAGAIKNFFDLSRFLAPIKKTSFEGDGPSGAPRLMNASFNQTSFEGNGPSGAPRLMNASFNPGDKKQVLQPIQMNLNLDGRTLAQALADVMEDLYTHPTSAASPNHVASFASLDNQFAST